MNVGFGGDILVDVRVDCLKLYRDGLRKFVDRM
jgi:hypothetical protein